MQSKILNSLPIPGKTRETSILQGVLIQPGGDVWVTTSKDYYMVNIPNVVVETPVVIDFKTFKQAYKKARQSVSVSRDGTITIDGGITLSSESWPADKFPTLPIVGDELVDRVSLQLSADAWSALAKHCSSDKMFRNVLSYAVLNTVNGDTQIAATDGSRLIALDLPGVTVAASHLVHREVLTLLSKLAPETVDLQVYTNWIRLQLGELTVYQVRDALHYPQYRQLIPVESNANVSFTRDALTHLKAVAPSGDCMLFLDFSKATFLIRQIKSKGRLQEVKGTMPSGVKASEADLRLSVNLHYLQDTLALALKESDCVVLSFKAPASGQVTSPILTHYWGGIGLLMPANPKVWPL
jgi:DNA polymerase III sliding clamp (beta) subunit (PCNA family)